MCSAVLASKSYGLLAVQQSMQPKAAVEFDQAINYVNKIKVCPCRTPSVPTLAALLMVEQCTCQCGVFLRNLLTLSACIDPFRER